MSEACLLDVNVLVSLAWPNHVHHGVALRWFRALEGSWATTPATECGFVRVSCNRAAVGVPVRPEEAISLLARLSAFGAHMSLPDDVELVAGGAEEGLVSRAALVSYKQVADAHLLALARRHGARLATLDAGVLALAGSQAKDVVLVAS